MLISKNLVSQFLVWGIRIYYFLFSDITTADLCINTILGSFTNPLPFQRSPCFYKLPPEMSSECWEEDDDIVDRDEFWKWKKNSRTYKFQVFYFHLSVFSQLISTWFLPPSNWQLDLDSGREIIFIIIIILRLSSWSWPLLPPRWQINN